MAIYPGMAPCQAMAGRSAPAVTPAAFQVLLAPVREEESRHGDGNGGDDGHA
jgi:hypothetical protein